MSIADRMVVAAQPLDDVIANLKANEQLYDELDVVLQAEYTIGDREPTRFEDKTRTEVSAKDARTHYVTQGGLFRLERTGARSSPSGSTSMDRIRAFDGTTTRLFEQNAIANITAGKSRDRGMISPHMLLLSNLGYTFPLSLFMSGENEVLAYSPKGWNSDSKLTISYVAEEAFDGLNCHKVSIATTIGDSAVPHNRWDLWLAEDRNYIPVRAQNYVFMYSKSMPFVDGSVSELREVKPGIWFPFSATVTAFQPLLLKFKAEQQLQWRYRYTVENVSLEPKYPLSYFQDVTFPDGTAVYEIENEQIKKAYRIGEELSSSGSSPVTRWWLVAINAVVAMGIILVINRSRYRKRGVM